MGYKMAIFSGAMAGLSATTAYLGGIAVTKTPDLGIATATLAAGVMAGTTTILALLNLYEGAMGRLEKIYKNKVSKEQ